MPSTTARSASVAFGLLVRTAASIHAPYSCQSSAGRLDTARCTDPTTFEVYPPTARMRACQTEHCLAPCGTPGNLCTPANCNAMCSNFSTNCQ